MVGRGAGLHPYHRTGVISVHNHVLKAACEIPLCVSYLFLVVQSFRVLLNGLREQIAQSPRA